MDENSISREIIGAAIEVHTVLGGPGLLESVYEESLCYELQLRGIEVERQIEVPVVYKGHRLSTYLRLDVLVGGLVIVECKATEEDHPIHQAQCLTHLRLTDKRLGLVVNFGQKLVKDGIHRVVNNL
ncbi:MAG: GxxExxY protein [Pirellulales bacterium]|nr:GxxExxY protein [Pirellulales bacterium]